MKTIPEELETLTRKHEFKKYHRQCDDKFTNHVRRFLTATMDEVRSGTSKRVALEGLKTIGRRVLDLFREAGPAGEIRGEIAYEQQRGHSAHTLATYLLGWYLFIHSGNLKKL